MKKQIAKKRKKQNKIPFKIYNFDLYNNSNWLVDQIDLNIFKNKLCSYYNSTDMDYIKLRLKKTLNDKIEFENLIKNLNLDNEIQLHKLIVNIYSNSFYNKKIIKKIKNRLKKLKNKIVI